MLTGPVGANRFLRYVTARDSFGSIEVFDQQGQLYRKICIKADALADSSSVLPSAFSGGFRVTRNFGKTPGEKKKPCNLLS